MKNYIKNNILFITVIVNILYLLIGTFLAGIVKISILHYSYGLIFVMLPINIIIGIISRKKFTKDVIYMFLISILVFSIISVIFAYDKNVALFGTYTRNEGIFMIAYYLSLIYLGSIVDNKDKKKIALFIIGIGIIQTIYGFIQKYSLLDVPVYIGNNKIHMSGFCMNPNFLGTLLLISLCYSIGMFFDSNKRKTNIIFFILLLILLTGLVMTDTLSCIMGLLFVFMYIIFYSIKNKKYKKLIILTISLIVVPTALQLANQTTLLQDLKLFKKQTTKMVTGKYETDYNFGSGRIYLWKKTFEYMPKYYLTGIGVDNFRFINKGLPIYRWGRPYDKAHNEYLQILATEGMFTLLSYLTLYFIITIRGIKSSIKYKELYLIIPIIGYLVQAFFNISVIQVAPLFYLTLGLNSRRQ